VANNVLSAGTLDRMGGVARASVSLSALLFVLFGVRGLLDVRRWWRMVLMLLVFVLGLLGGFRSNIVLGVMLFFMNAYLERLLRGRFLIGLLGGFMLLLAMVFAVSDKLPLSMQRAISFLPVEVDPLARQDASDSWQFRVEVWNLALPEVPQYLLLGKGYGFNAADLAQDKILRASGFYKDADVYKIVGGYHNGLLSILIPLGIPGLICVLGFFYGGWRVLLKNYRESPPHLRVINRGLLAVYSMRLIYFLVFYGQLDLDFYIFTSILGLSVALNRRAEAVVAVKTPSFADGRAGQLKTA
jgi:O-antigen ligase